jgi:hypothetical protein
VQIKKRIELPDGTFDVHCEFSEEEMDTIVEVGLNVLIANGAMPFVKDSEVYRVVAPSELEQ